MQNLNIMSLKSKAKIFRNFIQRVLERFLHNLYQSQLCLTKPLSNENEGGRYKSFNVSIIILFPVAANAWNIFETWTNIFEVLGL